MSELDYLRFIYNTITEELCPEAWVDIVDNANKRWEAKGNKVPNDYNN